MLGNLRAGATPADGKFGPHTHKAVCKVQEKHGLTVDGKVGKHTLAALERRDDDQ